MMSPKRLFPEQLLRVGWTLVVLVLFLVGGTLLLLWLAGKFEPKVLSSAVDLSPPVLVDRYQAVAARLVSLPRNESAVGTIRAVRETTIGSKLLARVVEIDLKAGQKVKVGDVLLRLDDTDLRAKVQQARAAQSAAEALHRQAVSDENRIAQLVQRSAAARQEYEKSVSAREAAEAELDRTREAVKESQAMLEWATIRSPITGTVIDKKVDMGDMVSPGQPLVALYDPKQMQLVASVRESLAHHLQVGQDIEVAVEGLNKQCGGTVSEIVPEAQSASRSFQVKVTGPCPPGIYTGMFGRILIPLKKEQVLLIPRRAVQQVGQLELVQVIANDQPSRRAIRTGRTFEDDVEVLSGLRPGEKVLIPSAASKVQEANHG